MKKIFNRNRILSLCLMIFSSVIGWYSLILFTNPCDSKNFPFPSKNQIYGLFFTIVIALQVWTQKCFTIIPKN